ncbi:ATP-dependent helicase HrpB [Sneathiella chinensis]|uniref:ATP-dependent helicase HrpB n=1 Tax=Sneathiella chinensis TaxID=349750 RepID=A0ABQ5U4N4_9PROT|nr:ATP-dependent helicase HrpB [Sneathiella chinensis]GLQ06160.1 ATP-dependent helicase HrpB [Sneathiella chinensis]
MTIEIPETGLPVEEVLPRLVQILEVGNRAVLQAPPGAGKTTTVPLWLLRLTALDGKKIIMLEPRRLAARAAARRMADLLGEEVGETVGYRIRLDTRVGAKTRIEVVTEGILTRMLQEDPDLSEVGALIFDEFHERNLNTDLGLALALQSQEILRDDLRLVVMSATLDTERVADLLGGAPVVQSDGRMFPVETRYFGRFTQKRVEGPTADCLKTILQQEQGDILVFLPGAGEINRTATALKSVVPADTVVLPLYGNLSQQEQDRALFPDREGRRKIVLATDIAETSLTIEGVRVVVDAGLARSPIFDPNSGMSRLETRRVSRASADQRRGRAGRMGPGICYRLWSEAEDRGLLPHAEPEIAVADLAALALELAKWGVTDLQELHWMTPPPDGLMGQARDLLTALGGIDDEGRILPLGLQMVRLPLHPRLAAMVIKAAEIGEQGLACDLAALLSERDFVPRNREFPNSDIRHRLVRMNAARQGRDKDVRIRQIMRNADDLRRRMKAGREPGAVEAVGIVLAFGYPDRIGELRKKSARNYRLSGGRGAVLPENDALQGEPYLVVADLEGRGRDAQIYLAAAITYSDLMDRFEQDIRTETRVFWDDQKEKIIALEERKIGALVLDETRIKSPPADLVAKALCDLVRGKQMRILPWSPASRGLIDRVAFARKHDAKPGGWPDFSDPVLLDSLEDWLMPYLAGKTTLSDLERLDLYEILKGSLSWEQQEALDRFAPAFFEAPTGSRLRLDYSDPDIPVLAVRIQEMFGQAEGPVVADGSIAVSIHLLSPARRPAQITRDLGGFWKNSYTAVKKDLKGQYPKHYWPDDPMVAEPTARAKPRKG